MKKTQWIYKAVAAALILGLLLGLLALGKDLSSKGPAQLSEEFRQILPEADQPIPEQTDGDDEQPAQETEPTEPEPTEPEQEQTQPQVEPEPDENPGGNGDTNESPGEPLPDEGPEDDSALRIVTDLYNGQITFDQLNNDVLPFYAYLINGDGLTLRVKLRNSATPQNGQYLTGNGKDYEATLCRNETNFFTLYVKDGTATVQEVTYALRYVAQKADKDHPTVGEHPPTVVTNLEGVTQLSNRNFTLTVQATAYTGRNLYSSNIEVMLDSQRVTGPTGGPVYEYQLYFKDPEVGDVTHHTVTVLAWDDEGNSAFYLYSFDYHFVDTGGEIGTAYIILDATTVGLGVLEEPYTYRIKQNVPASYAVMEMLEEYGFEYDYGGTPDVGFYLRRITRGGMMDYTDIPVNLWNKVLQDGLTLTGQIYSDSLGEFDFTQGSGWMYSVGGAVYAGKGLSGYYLNNGETLYLRFTLAYGKDIGGYSSTGGTFGTLSTYCGKWINDTYVDMHQWGEAIVTREPTCTEAGETSAACNLCGDKKDSVELPALGHSYSEVSRTEPANGSDGFVLYECAHCKEQMKEIISWKEEATLPPEQTE